LSITIHSMGKIENILRRVRRLARRTPIMCARALRAEGIHPEYLRRLCAGGLLVKVGRGVYMLPDAEVTPRHGLALAATVVPKGVICLLSALRFHGIGTQSPSEVWVAIDQRAARPRAAYPRMRFVRSSGRSLTAGVEVRRIEGVPVKVACVARTVADCFKHRNKIGLDVALEALREARRGRRCTNDELWRYARLCRVTETMRPYMEAMT